MYFALSMVFFMVSIKVICSGAADTMIRKPEFHSIALNSNR